VEVLERKAREIKVGPGGAPGADMDAYTEELFGPVLAVLRVETLDEAIALINANPYGNGAALFTAAGEAARRFQRNIHIGMIGINVPVPVPMSYYSCGGWKDSLIGDSPIHGPEGIRFHTRPRSSPLDGSPNSVPSSVRCGSIGWHVTVTRVVAHARSSSVRRTAHAARGGRRRSG
jgi:hypothetical protein